MLPAFHQYWAARPVFHRDSGSSDSLRQLIPRGSSTIVVDTFRFQSPFGTHYTATTLIQPNGISNAKLPPKVPVPPGATREIQPKVKRVQVPVITINTPVETLPTRVGTISSRGSTISSRGGTILSRDGTILSRDGTIFAREKIIFARVNIIFAREKVIFARVKTIFAREKIIFARVKVIFAREKIIFSPSHFAQSTASHRQLALSSRPWPAQTMPPAPQPTSAREDYNNSRTPIAPTVRNAPINRPPNPQIRPRLVWLRRRSPQTDRPRAIPQI